MRRIANVEIDLLVRRAPSTGEFKDHRVEADQRLAAAVGSSQDAILSADREGVITAWSRGAERMFGYTEPEAIGQPVGLLIPPSHRGEDGGILRHVLAGERVENYETERVCQDGSILNVSLSVSPIYGPDGRVVGTSWIAHDLTSAIRAQQQVALQAELLDEVGAAVIFADSSLVVRYWSRGAQRLYGYTTEEAIGRELLELMVPEESRSEALELERIAREGRLVEGELDVRDKQGRIIPVYFRVRPFPEGDEVGPGRGIISIGVDISAWREAEALARRSFEKQEEIASLGRLAL
jgi:PAS domain S-box-containing protein